MAGSDRAFSSGLVSFIKYKIFTLADQKNFPYELLSFKALVQSKTFKDKIESNDISILDTVLRIIPFVFGRQIVVCLFENGKLSETVYKGPNPKKSKDGEAASVPENNEADGIHLLIEKAFLSITVFGLFPCEVTPFTVQSKSPIKTASANIVLMSKETPIKPVMTDSPTLYKKASKVRTLTIEDLSHGPFGEILFCQGWKLNYMMIKANGQMKILELDNWKNTFTVEGPQMSYHCSTNKQESAFLNDLLVHNLEGSKIWQMALLSF